MEFFVPCSATGEALTLTLVPNLIMNFKMYAFCFFHLKESIPDEERVQPCRENTYVRVCGTVRSFGGKKSVVAFKMVPVLDMNELTYHLLEVIHSHASLSSSQTQVQ